MKNTATPVIIDNKEWFTHWFDSAFYHKLYNHRDEKEAARFIDELITELNPSPSSQMLDLGCGNGRHSKYLASKGFTVTGIDLAASSISEAKRSETSSLRFYRHDMRVPFGKNYFDYVFNFFTSFGYFKTNDEDDNVIGNIASSLKPGGILVMDYINSRHAEKKLIASEEKEIDGIIYHISRWTDKEYFFKKITVNETLFGNPLEYTEQVKKFSIEDFDRLLSNNGLQITNIFGDYQLSEYDPESSPRIILTANKISHQRKNN